MSDFVKSLCKYRMCRRASATAGIIAVIFPIKLAIHLHDFVVSCCACLSLCLKFLIFFSGTFMVIFLVSKVNPK
ncbi:hypothetical protein G6F37_013703 [Rhizopus arrhizus]|nr:hypothetical protein G6F38_013636 [Rhizopus arrhizus]KAG1136565.1 hypothetical protein G6F37_013703 [Rhizopus arrhizus]